MQHSGEFEVTPDTGSGATEERVKKAFGSLLGNGSGLGKRFQYGRDFPERLSERVEL
jgi:hypothetical protein